MLDAPVLQTASPFQLLGVVQRVGSPVYDIADGLQLRPDLNACPVRYHLDSGYGSQSEKDVPPFPAYDFSTDSGSHLEGLFLRAFESQLLDDAHYGCPADVQLLCHFG